MPIPPHGGELVNRILSGDALAQAEKKAQTLPRLRVDAYLAFDIDAIGKGILSPLRGFMTEEETYNVLNHMYLRTGIPWTIPILLHASQQDADRLEVGGDVALEDEEGRIVAVLHLQEKFGLDKKELAEKVYRTTDSAHPGVAYTYQHGPVYLAGPIDVLRPRVVEPQQYNLSPAQTREAFKLRGWKRIVAFQTRNPIHRAHEYLTKCALEMCDGLLIHPLMGTTKSDDIPGDVRMKCYEVLIEKYYPPKHTMLSIMPVNMRYAGPREAVMHAIMRKNYGCTHFIVGRDHAGVGNYYGTYDAHYIFDEFDPAELGITPLFFEHSFYCRTCGNMASLKTCPHDSAHHVHLSGTKVREMLAAGQEPPVEFSRREVARILIEWATSQRASA
jgi:sulfate adenylyltransferase